MSQVRSNQARLLVYVWPTLTIYSHNQDLGRFLEYNNVLCMIGIFTGK